MGTGWVIFRIFWRDVKRAWLCSPFWGDAASVCGAVVGSNFFASV